MKKRFAKNQWLERQYTILAKGTGTDPIVNSGPSTHDPGEAEQGSISQSIWVPISRVNRPFSLVLRLLWGHAQNAWHNAESPVGAQ